MYPKQKAEKSQVTDSLTQLKCICEDNDTVQVWHRMLHPRQEKAISTIIHYLKPSRNQQDSATTTILK